MDQIDVIKELQREGFGPTDIASRLGFDRKTVSKYMDREDFSPNQDHAESTGSKLDRWKSKIDEWLEEDRTMRYKQRHTAKRVHDRLRTEYAGDYDCSYPLVQRYLKSLKERRGKKKGYLELVWAPGEAQADFGEADIVEAGTRRIMKYLIVSFPASNAAYMQAFGGETAECVIQGLTDVFNHLGGVPLRIVFDNASGVGRRVHDKVTFSELFLRFKCHNGFSVSFCNPESGNEKGNVENKVGYVRRNFFVPLPVIESMQSWNRELFAQAERDFDRLHYKKGRSIAELFEEDKKALGSLPEKPFRIERFERVKTDGYGKFCLDGKHWYSSAPELGQREIVVGIGAHAVTVYRENGEIVSVHARIYGEERSDTVDYRTSLDMLLRKPGAWRNSGLRAALHASSREFLDGLEKSDRTRILETLTMSAGVYGFDVAIESLDEAIARGTVDTYSVQALAARAAYAGLAPESATGPDLQLYDAAFLTNAGGAT